MLALIASVGLLVGVTLGGLGAGGSILAVPALVYLAGQGAAEATTGSLVVVGTSALVGVLPHLQARRVHLGRGAAFGALGVGGAYAGSRLSVDVPAAVLMSSFAGLMLVVAALMVLRQRANGRSRRRATRSLRARPGGRSPSSSRPRPGWACSPGSSGSAAASPWCRPWSSRCGCRSAPPSAPRSSSSR